MEKFCIKCGAKLEKDVKFCTSCGQKVEEIKEKPKPKVEKSKPAPPSKETSEPTPPVQEISEIISPESKPPKQSKPVDKIIFPAIIVALILSVAAIIMPFVVGSDADLSTGSVDTDKLASNSVTSAKIADGTITDTDIISTGISNIATKSITGDHINEGSINFSHLKSDLYDVITGITEIANGSITSAKIADFTIAAKDIANNSITSVKIAADAVGSSEIQDGAVTDDEIATGAVTDDEIASGAVGSSEIANGAISTVDIGDDAVTYAKMDIKIKYDLATGVVHGLTINHGLGSTPTAVILTPEYNSSIGPLQANVYNVDSTSFQIALWKEVLNSLTTVSGSEPQRVYWIAIYS